MTIAKFSLTITLLLFVVSASSSASQTTHTPQQQNIESDATETATYSNYEEYAPLMLSRVNKEREVNGLPQLCANKKLRAAAYRYYVEIWSRAAYMQSLSHEKLSQYVIEAGYACDGKSQSPTFNCDNVGSNGLSYGRTVDAVMDVWMKSSTRNKTIMGNFSQIGFVYVFNDKEERRKHTKH